MITGAYSNLMYLLSNTAFDSEISDFCFDSYNIYISFLTGDVICINKENLHKHNSIKNFFKKPVRNTVLVEEGTVLASSAGGRLKVYNFDIETELISKKITSYGITCVDLNEKMIIVGEENGSATLISKNDFKVLSKINIGSDSAVGISSLKNRAYFVTADGIFLCIDIRKPSKTFCSLEFDVEFTSLTSLEDNLYAGTTTGNILNINQNFSHGFIFDNSVDSVINGITISNFSQKYFCTSNGFIYSFSHNSNSKSYFDVLPSTHIDDFYSYEHIKSFNSSILISDDHSHLYLFGVDEKSCTPEVVNFFDSLT